ncbi:MAG: hypothetical protein COB02_02910 [Candidatus Cloacimonadota bacterium]|nr:MAG: hypothetical protein COB02_02910 [Candidatus Cloacimonadota bacterium]
MESFETFSLHQKINFIDDVIKRVEPILPKPQYKFLGTNQASNQELILNCNFCKALHYIQDHLEPINLNQIYRKLNPGKMIKLPPLFRDQSFVIAIVSKLFNDYHNTLQIEKILELIQACLVNLGCISSKEASALNNILDFESSSKTIILKFQDQSYHIHLNSRSRLGYELTILRKES